MVEVVRMDRQDFDAFLLGAAARWLSPAEHGGRVTLLVANPACNDAAYAHSVVVLQPGESEDVGVMLNRPGEPELVLWRPGELAEELKRGVWLKVEVPAETPRS